MAPLERFETTGESRVEREESVPCVWLCAINHDRGARFFLIENMAVVLF